MGKERDIKKDFEGFLAEHAPLINLVMGRLIKKSEYLRHCINEDEGAFIEVGMMAIMESASKYNSKQGGNFSKCAQKYIYWRMIDLVRRKSVVPIHFLQSAKRLQALAKAEESAPKLSDYLRKIKRNRKNKFTQKDIVFLAIVNQLGEKYDPKKPMRSSFGSVDRRGDRFDPNSTQDHLLHETVEEIIRKVEIGQVTVRETLLCDKKKLRVYIRKIIHNWLNKDPRLNGFKKKAS
jgi:hypothetical protein